MRWKDITEARIQHQIDAATIGENLYHGTSILGLIKILDDNSIKGSHDRVRLTGVSCTTKLWWAQNYARVKTIKELWSAAGPKIQQVVLDHAGKGEGPILVLDAQKIVKDFEVRAVSWSKKSPVEERIVGDLAPLSSYLIKIVVDKDTMNLYQSALEERMENKPSKVWKQRYEAFINSKHHWEVS